MKAVGWLDVTEPYTRGPVTRSFFETLVGLLVEPWQPFAAGGGHRCQGCRFSGGPGQLHFAGVTIAIGSSNVFVPGTDVIYAAPSLVAHYIDAHEYQPPEELIRAVEACPPMRSMDYLRRLRSAGGSGFTELMAHIRGQQSR
jgi:hypothetical protein